MRRKQQKRKTKRTMFLPIILAAGDQLLKTAAEQKLEKGEERTLFFPFVLRRVENRGMCMNLLSGKPDIVKYFSIAASAIVTGAQCFCFFCRKNFLWKAGLSIMASGAWSNTFDRVFRGHVVDYIGIKTKVKKLSDITYNLADFFIAAGAVLTVLSYLGDAVREKRNKE